MNGAGAGIVQRDFTVLLEKEHPGFGEARVQLTHFAELVKSPASYHTYRITPLSLWNAAASGLTAKEIIEMLRFISRFDMPAKVVSDIEKWISRYGSLKLWRPEHEPATLWLECQPENVELLDRLQSESSLSKLHLQRVEAHRMVLSADFRGVLKQELARLGYPVTDEVGYHNGHPLSFNMRSSLGNGEPLLLRPYQKEGVISFAGQEKNGENGVLVLPCGAGKTVIGIAVMERFQCETLILTSNVTSVHQWITEILEKTTLSEEDVGEYSGGHKQVRPVTVSTYQILTHRASKGEGFKHMGLFNQRDWGLIIYDEVHLLPAPVFRATADIQATRRLGLTATLVREDGCECDVFSLIGPKRYEVPWRELEKTGFIAQVECCEVRVSMPMTLREHYIKAEGRAKFRIAAENPRKIEWLRSLIERHSGRQILIIGQYLDQLRSVASRLYVPLITGNMPQDERGDLFAAFRAGDIHVLVVSKVANFAVDLPDASVAIQISGSFGSRQEEAQRLGRILRPKSDGSQAYFYTLVSEDTREQDFAMRRQLFLIEQGYEYSVTFDLEDGSNFPNAVGAQEGTHL
ncbi:DNA excision repair protein ERCC-3 [Paenibacillus anaericanus]|uniref:DNA repair helicase XPB n=1 Tax=Paenibacillus anaericanus TaxID=170367 RepID=UPI00278AF2C2|nr:DNA repair helicase XPB [Paenibacillus anaericanus]MDQ0088316.1 DNA excision repair protein ERCC-3 [Paenibacillus anaericanus]